MPQAPITLQRFYTEFRHFVKAEEKRWQINEKGWEANNRRWEADEKRWGANEKIWAEHTRILKSLRKRIDDSVNFLDRDILEDRRRIEALEQHAAFSC